LAISLFALAEVGAETQTLATRGLAGGTLQARPQLGVLAVRLVIQEVEVVVILFHGEQDGNWLALGIHDISSTLLAQSPV
jgi:hypothetical protein